MNTMMFIEISLLMIVIYAGIYATITDLKNSIIPNKMIIKALVASILLSATYYLLYARDLVPLYLINLLCTSVFAFFFYTYNLWAAGDSKLLFLIMAAIPARAYYMNPFGPFPGFFVILITFSIAFICIVIDSIYQGIKEKNLFKWSIQLPRLTDLLMSYFFMVGSMTLVNILLESGEITENDAKTHPQKNVLMKALGAAEIIEMDIFEVVINEENDKIDGIFLCSDGLTNMMSVEQMEKVLNDTELDIEEQVGKMIMKANMRGGTDNITIAYARLSGE